MKVTVAIDSFKGSMTSLEAGNAVRAGILSIYSEACVKVYPVADGGEGTVEALVYASDEKVGSITKNIILPDNLPDNIEKNNTNAIRRQLYVTGPLGDKVNAEYTLIDKTKTAIIEMSSAAGLPLVPIEKRNPLYTTTYGVGELIRDAIKQGCRHFIIGIGGSATNDGGIGMLQALGYRFVDAKGNDVPYGAKGLSMLSDIYFEDALPELSECTFRIACDVKNPLVGAEGCSAVFAPQKGASSEMVQSMELYMKRYADLVEHIAMCDMGEIRGKANRNYPGTGAAGGLGYAFLMFFNSVLESGVDIILGELGIENDIKDSDLVITGEGKMDSQTINGKTPIGVSRLAKKYGKKVIAFAGIIDENAKCCLESGFIDKYYQIERNGMDIETAMLTENAVHNLENTVRNVIDDFFE